MADDSDSSAVLRHRVQSRLAESFMQQLQDDSQDRPQQAKEEKLSRINAHTIFWLVASMAMFYYTDIAVALRVDPRINWLWLLPGAVLIGLNVGIGAFLIVWLSWIKGVSTDEWEKRYPSAIPTATASFIIGGLCCMVGLWPVWGFLTPIILFTLFMGVVMVISLFP
ncbi:PREDICTED: transmembrane protein 128-like [Branchiostoma belcheri]|uniref:Transmembrane protein 128-like n=1 Tax=Branchiostoma belcheri TaxID=7741 RepID=A0A6P4YPZ9_BRABE|nr:PREDICTED: transmembrane protein 128-like [Branchiostoma belcheri]XP_019620732.1 PREDICTED: transmembrane protein 128-like [Branchiostoma belcheri]